jgi:hypothetical protein
MSVKQKLFESKSERGATIRADGKDITPVAQATTVRFGNYGAAIWNRPKHIEITENGRTVRQQIPNLTLIGQLIGLAAAIVIGMITWLIIAIYRTW